MVTSKERFRKTMNYESPDRVPYFEEGIRDEVIRAWRSQGLSGRRELERLFRFDDRVEIEPDLEPLPAFESWPTKLSDLKSLESRLNPNDDKRLPDGWRKDLKRYRKGDQVLMLRVHRGLFLSFGIRDWRRFMILMQLLMSDPEFIHRYMEIYGQFAAGLADRILSEVTVDAALFSEPIGGNDRPLISPAMYERFVLSSYEPVLDVLKRRGVETIVLRTYANARILIPSLLKWGFNCLWACEVNIDAMDYGKLRAEYGRDLRLIGGIDLDSLREGKDAIRREVEEKVAPLVADGGYVPLADGRVREDIPYENYLYYRRLLEDVV